MLAPPSERSTLVRYGGALAILAAATLLRLWFDPVLAGGGFMIFFLAVVIASWFGGLGPSLLALLLSLALSSWLFDPSPDHSSPARTLSDWHCFSSRR
jgi:K+-sensing histidine kinase KdpD